jgi:hypothetical protein
VHYRKLFRAGETGPDSNWGATRMQYLEKIFQIPFSLPPVTQAGYRAMVDTLTTSAPPTESSATGTGDSPLTPADTADTAGTTPMWPPPLPAAPVVERFDPLALTDDERQLIALLGPPLVTTPRSIKRLVNSYGLLNGLRGSQHQQDLSEARHPGTGATYYPYRAGIALLGTLIAFTDLSPAFFPCLWQASAEPDAGNWPQFLKQQNPEHRWRRLASALEKLTADAAEAGLPLPEPLEAWAEWVVPVGRLSIETGRAVVALSPP